MRITFISTFGLKEKMMQDLFYKYNTEKSIPDDLQALAAIIQL
jgi:hypothetical protein